MDFLREIYKLKDKVPHKSNPYVETALRVMEEWLGWTELNDNIIGVYGDVVFEVSTMKVETLREFKRQARGRYATHDIVGGKSIIEFLGTEPDEITFTMQLSADLGVDIKEELVKLLEMLRNGDANYLILGGWAHGKNKWALTTLDFRIEHTDGWGEPVFVTADVTLKEALE